jgi:hypothetical protein
MKLILSFISVFMLFYFTPEEVIQQTEDSLLGKSEFQAKNFEKKSANDINEFKDYLPAEQVSNPENPPLEPIETYTNEEGHQIQSPTRYEFAPEGASALCRDGTYSFSENRRGTCSHHGGVAKWLR